MLNQMHVYFSVHDLYYHGQYGFREKHSTQHAALELIDIITQELDKCQTPINIYIDLSKAFDTLNREILISKLKHYGINGSAIKLVDSYLSNRKQYVQFNNTSSTQTGVSTGVPRGSILGPLLFIIYINDIVHSSNLYEFIIFAEDTTLFTSINNQANTVYILTDELGKFYNWLIANKLSLSVNKTKAMILHMPQKKVPNYQLTTAGSHIEFVDNFNFLGIAIDKHLSWTYHINLLCAKISKITGIINRLKHVLPVDILRTIDHFLILCHLTYGVLL